MIADLTPSDPIGQKLCEIFSHRWLAIAGSTEDPKDAKWQTIGGTISGKGKYPLHQRTLWAMWQDPAQLVGVRFDDTTTYGLIDVDRNSQFFSPSGIKAICEAMETIGIVRPVILRSSFSGGIHIYLPLPSPVKTFDLAAAIKYALEGQEIHLAPGQVESFPNCKSFGRSWLNEFTQYNAHRLPLQPGSGSILLNQDFQPDGARLESFFWRWDYAQRLQDMDMLAEALHYGRDQHRKRRKIKHSPAETWRADLELDISEGWTGRGQTNHLLKQIACYGRVFEKLSGYELAEFVERIAVTRPGYLDYCQHRHEIDSRARAWARAAEKYYWPLATAPKRQSSTYSINTDRAEDAIARIKKAVLTLATTGELPEIVHHRAKKICDMAHTSAQTLYKYLSLWHPSQWCVIADGAGDTADPPPDSDPTCDRSEPLQAGLLHTFKKYMKGSPVENHLKKNFTLASEGLDGGLGEGEGFPQGGSST